MTKAFALPSVLSVTCAALPVRPLIILLLYLRPCDGCGTGQERCRLKEGRNRLNVVTVEQVSHWHVIVTAWASERRRGSRQKRHKVIGLTTGD